MTQQIEARAQVDAFAGLVQSVNAQIHESDANLATAKLNQSYTRILAPESGWVTQKSVEPGAYVQAGQNLFALVPKKVWVTANFKEDQIGRMQPGQRVEIEVDALHGRKFRGLVDSIQAGGAVWGREFGGANRHDFIRHELLQAHTWTTLMALDQPKPHALLSKMIQHFFGVANDQMQSGGRVVMMEAYENPRYKIPRHIRDLASFSNRQKRLQQNRRYAVDIP
jgi:hypothetical protein